MNELDFQKCLVDSAIADGGFGYKASHRDLNGILDLVIQIPEYPTWFIECKFDRHPIENWTKVHVNLSPHQANTMRQLQRSGGRAGWVVLVPMKDQKDCYHMVMGVDPSAKYAKIDSEAIRRLRGGDWHATAVIRSLSDLDRRR